MCTWRVRSEGITAHCPHEREAACLLVDGDPIRGAVPAAALQLPAHRGVHQPHPHCRAPAAAGARRPGGLWARVRIHHVAHKHRRFEQAPPGGVLAAPADVAGAREDLRR